MEIVSKTEGNKVTMKITGWLDTQTSPQLGEELHVSNPTEQIGIMKAYYSERIDMIWRAAEKAEPELAPYIVKGVTEGLSYDVIKVKMDIPCCKDVYYAAYRRFFWILNKERD